MPGSPYHNSGRSCFVKHRGINIEALIIRIAFWGRIYCSYNKEPPKQYWLLFRPPSVFGDRVKTLGKPYREIIVYDKDQIYPEYLVLYERLLKK